MSRNNFQILTYDTVGTQSFTIAPTETEVVDIDLTDIANLQLLVRVAYSATDDPTGVSLILYYGFGSPDPDSTGGVPCVLGGTGQAIFSDNSDTVTMTTIAPSEGPVSEETFFNVLVDRVPRWLRLSFTNEDATNASTITIYGDI